MLITNKDKSEITESDLLVIMMNPGSSEPKNHKNIFTKPYYDFNQLVLTEPDNTQFQIMKVMDKCSYRTAIIINLSDVREAKSTKFIRKIRKEKYTGLGLEHSIFSSKRKNELQKVLNKCKNSKVIIASGVNYKLRYLTQIAVNSVKNKYLVGKVKRIRGYELYYHPLPRSKTKQIEWINLISSEIT